MKKLAICSVACAALLLSSCATSKVEESAEIPTVEPAFTVIQGSWETTELTKDGNAVTGSTASITFAEPSYNIYGNNGVNNYFGSATIDGTAFDATESLGSTMMAGTPDQMSFEEGYMWAITHADTIGRSGSNLVISGPTTCIIYDFNGEEFETVKVTVDGKEVTGAKATIKIETVYPVNGTSGVNTYNGEITVSPVTNFKAGDFAVTRMLGTPDAQEFENTFLSAMTEATDLSFEDNMLKIAGPNSTIYFNGVMTIAD